MSKVKVSKLFAQLFAPIKSVHEESCEKTLQTFTFFATFCSHKKRCNSNKSYERCYQEIFAYCLLYTRMIRARMYFNSLFPHWYFLCQEVYPTWNSPSGQHHDQRRSEADRVIEYTVCVLTINPHLAFCVYRHRASCPWGCSKETRKTSLRIYLLSAYIAPHLRYHVFFFFVHHASARGGTRAFTL